ncbi:REP-associated tyrosine transposase [Marinospirillum sp.]|uniref:REP-associated tyrosine transposase n=1 Tax=Marinospirillum sp. TaxID=2183934 RepID=UPI00384D5BC3
MPSSHRLRIGRFSQSSQVYLITCVTQNRSPIFFDFYTAHTLMRSFRDTESHAYTWAYVIMPDHFHWLVQLGEETSLSDQVHFVKSSATRKIRNLCNSSLQIWQAGFHDRQLRKEDDLKAMARYVIANPVRAGLTNSVRNYSFWDAGWI